MKTHSFVVTLFEQNDEFWENRARLGDYAEALAEIISNGLGEVGFYKEDDFSVRPLSKGFEEKMSRSGNLPAIPRGMIAEDLPSKTIFRGTVARVRNGMAEIDLEWYLDHEEELKEMPHSFSVYAPHVQRGDTVESIIEVV